MSEDSISIMKVEQYLLRSKTPETRLCCLFFMYISFGDEKKRDERARATNDKYGPVD